MFYSFLCCHSDGQGEISLLAPDKFHKGTDPNTLPDFNIAFLSAYNKLDSILTGGQVSLYSK